MECPYEVIKLQTRTFPATLPDRSQGHELLHSSQFNKGTAFPQPERKGFGLRGLLPPNSQTLDEQVERAYQQFSSRPDDLAKNTFLASMRAQNEVLYYKVSRPRPDSCTR